MEISQQKLVEYQQREEREKQLKEKQEQIHEIKSAMASRREALKQLKAQLTQLEHERDSIIEAKSPVVVSPTQLRMPFGVSDSPLSALHIKKSLIAILQTAGIERVPDLVKACSGEDKRFPEGLSSVEGLKPAGAKQIREQLQDYLDRDPSKEAKAKATEESTDSVEWPDRATILIDTAEGYEQGSEVKGKYSSDDKMFTVDGYVFSEGEYKLVHVG